MSAETFDLVNEYRVEQGATYRFLAIWKDTNEDPVNLSGWSANLDIRRTPEDDEAIAQWGTDTGEIVLTDQGRVEVTVSDEATSVLEPGSFIYDLKLTNATGDSVRLIEGKVTISPEVTR